MARHVTGLRQGGQTLTRSDEHCWVQLCTRGSARVGRHVLREDPGDGRASQQRASFQACRWAGLAAATDGQSATASHRLPPQTEGFCCSGTVRKACAARANPQAVVRRAGTRLMRPTMPKSMKPTLPSGSTSRLPACTSAGAGKQDAAEPTHVESRAWRQQAVSVSACTTSWAFTHTWQQGACAQVAADVFFTMCR